MSDSDLAVLPSEPALSQYPSSTWTCSSPEPINRDLPIAPDSDAPDASDAPEGDGRDADSESDVTPGEPKSVDIPVVSVDLDAEQSQSQSEVPDPDVGDDTDSLKGLSVKSGLMASLKGIFNPTPAQNAVPPSDDGEKPGLKRAVSVVQPSSHDDEGEDEDEDDDEDKDEDGDSDDGDDWIGTE